MSDNTNNDRVFFLSIERSVHFWYIHYWGISNPLPEDIRSTVARLLYMVDEKKWVDHAPASPDVDAVLVFITRNWTLLKRCAKPLAYMIHSAMGIHHKEFAVLSSEEVSQPAPSTNASTQTETHESFVGGGERPCEVENIIADGEDDMIERDEGCAIAKEDEEEKKEQSDLAASFVPAVCIHHPFGSHHRRHHHHHHLHRYPQSFVPPPLPRVVRKKQFFIYRGDED